jgi:hypothetical protein
MTVYKVMSDFINIVCLHYVLSTLFVYFNNRDIFRQFRVIPADEFLSTFASDRSHMLDEDGKWLKTPPSYPCLQTKGIFLEH